MAVKTRMSMTLHPNGTTTCTDNSDWINEVPSSLLLLQDARTHTVPRCIEMITPQINLSPKVCLNPSHFVRAMLEDVANTTTLTGSSGAMKLLGVIE